MSTSERKSFLEKEFVERFGKPPVLFVQAPDRVDLMGSHTDYNLGYVPREAIDRTTRIAVRPRTDNEVRIAMYNAFMDVPGIFNSRSARSGFGGCLVAFVSSDSIDSFAQQVREQYAASTGIDPEIYPVQAAQSASVLPFE